MLANHPVYHDRTKHIEVHYHFVREKILVGDIDLVYVSTKEQVADIFTKALDTKKLCKFRGLLDVLDLDLSLKGDCWDIRLNVTCDAYVTVIYVTSMVGCGYYITIEY